MIDGVLFDLDNTLLDRKKAFRSFFYQCNDVFRTSLSEQAQERLIEELEVLDDDGYGNKDRLYAYWVQEAKWQIGQTPETLREYYEATIYNMATPVQGAFAIIDKLRELGVTIGIITNGKSHAQLEKMKASGMDRVVADYWISESFGEAKPKPSIFHYACRALKLRESNTLYVGDHPVNDIQGAYNAGMIPVWVRGKREWDEAVVPPQHTIEALEELIQIVQEDRED